MSSTPARKLVSTDLSIDGALSPVYVSQIKDLAVREDWGSGDEVLKGYLALHVPLAISQGRYLWDGKRILMRAGLLATPSGAAIHLGLARAGGQWSLDWTGTRPANIEALAPADLGPWPEFDLGMDVVVAVDRFEEPSLAGLMLVAQQAAIAGAVRWSMHRDLAARHLCGDVRSYVVPVHLRDRDDGPELAATVEVQDERLLVRALDPPHAVYAHARAVAERRDELPLWVRDAWGSATDGQ